jgi:hypothetical protein
MSATVTATEAPRALPSLTEALRTAPRPTELLVDLATWFHTHRLPAPEHIHRHDTGMRAYMSTLEDFLVAAEDADATDITVLAGSTGTLWSFDRDAHTSVAYLDPAATPAQRTTRTVIGLDELREENDAELRAQDSTPAEAATANDEDEDEVCGSCGGTGGCDDGCCDCPECGL